MSNTKIPKPVQYEIWWKAAGRCEFKGCNKPLYLHGVTLDKCNISQYAHIIADSINGPRGDEELSKILAKDPKNIILLCPECHKYIDHEGKGKYDADTLFAMKKRHEERMEYLTGLNEDLQANIVVYGANIAGHKHDFAFPQLQDALLPNYYPANRNVIELDSISYEGEEWRDYWQREEDSLAYQCKTKILDYIDRWEYKRIALFSLAPMPLLVRLGTMLNNKHEVVVYNKHRNGGWKWSNNDSSIEYIINKPSKYDGVPVLVLSLSFPITDRIKKENSDACIWEITIANPNTDFLQSPKMLYDFGRTVENVLDEITRISNGQPINLYLAAPVACCIEFGRVWMQKANSPLNIYDYDTRVSKTDKLAITINK